MIIPSRPLLHLHSNRPQRQQIHKTDHLSPQSAQTPKMPASFLLCFFFFAVDAPAPAAETALHNGGTPKLEAEWIIIPCLWISLWTWKGSKLEVLADGRVPIGDGVDCDAASKLRKTRPGGPPVLRTLRELVHLGRGLIWPLTTLFK